MDLIINVEIFLLIHKSLSQYAQNAYYQHPQPYTQAAYFELYDDQEYKWPKNNIKSRRKKNKYTDYYISAKLNYGPNKLKCKCRKNKHSFDEQRKDCCQSFCDKCLDESELSEYEPYKIMPLKFPTTYVPLLPWFGFGQDSDTSDEDADQKSKIKDKKVEEEKDKNGEDKNDRDKKNKNGSDENDKDSRDEKDKNDRDKIDKNGRDEKHKDGEDKNGKDKKVKNGRDENDKDSRDEKDNDNKNKINKNGRDEKDKDNRDEKDINGMNNNDSKNGNKKNGSYNEDANKSPDDNVVDDETRDNDKDKHSTVPYRGDLDNKLLLTHFPKKKKCLRNNYLKDNIGSRVGRYFYNDLIMRPTLDGSLYHNSASNKKIYNHINFA